MKLEKDIEYRIVKYIEDELGGLCLKLRYGGRGFPDRTVLLPRGRVFFLEIKRDDGRLSAHQRYWMRLLRGYGYCVEVVKTLDDAKRVVSQIESSSKLLDAIERTEQ